MNEQMKTTLQRLVEIAVCPQDHSALRVGPQELADRLNELIGQRCLREQSGTLLTAPLDAVLVRSDNDRAYPIREGIPVLLVAASISLTDEDHKLL